MSEGIVSKRRIGLISVNDFAVNLRRALSEAGMSDEEQASVVTSHLSACCSACGAGLAPDDLVALLIPSAKPGAGAVNRMSMVRLRQGYCVGLRCDSRYYEFVFQPHPQIDWSLISSSYQPPEGFEVVESQSLFEMALSRVRKAFRWQFAVAVLALWMFYQWYNGGSIPVLRPAKTFTNTITTSPESLPDWTDW